MAGFSNDILVAENVDFRDVKPAVGQMTADGQLLIGAATAPYIRASNLTAGTGITVTNGPGTISIATNGSLVPNTITGDSGGALNPTAGNWNIVGGTNVTTSGSGSTLTINVSGGMAWSEETASPVSAAVNRGYIANLGSLLTFNLPGTFAVGDIIHIVGKGAGLWVIDAPAGDTIHFGNQDTSSGGTITATNRYDAIQIIGTVANSEWTVTGVAQGNLTVA